MSVKKPTPPPNKPLTLKKRINKLLGDLLWYTETINDKHKVEEISFDLEDCTITLEQLNRLSTLVGSKDITLVWTRDGHAVDASLEIQIKMGKK
jgi:hypothetical protein